MDCGLVSAALAQLVGEEHAVARNVCEADRGVGVTAQGGGIDEAFIFRCGWLSFGAAPVQPRRT